MKTFLFLAFCLLAACLTTAAQTAMPPGHAMLADPEKFADGHLAALDQRVQLTDEQKPTVRAVFLDEGKQLFALLNDASLSPQQRKAGIEKLHLQTAAKVNSLLTPEQRRRAGPQQQPPAPTHTSQT